MLRVTNRLRSTGVDRPHQCKVENQNRDLPVEFELLRDTFLELRCIAEEERPDDLHDEHGAHRVVEGCARRRRAPLRRAERRAAPARDSRRRRTYEQQ